MDEDDKSEEPGSDPEELEGQPEVEVNNANDEQIKKKCHKILNLLRKHKSSWPFRNPVDPIAMGIPHYTSIIPHPMDLHTIECQLSSHKYKSMPQFYGDIRLIISNSFTFNINNTLYENITTDFAKYFDTLKEKDEGKKKYNRIEKKKIVKKKGVKGGNGTVSRK
jgi:hypothetical protein